MRRRGRQTIVAFAFLQALSLACYSLGASIEAKRERQSTGVTKRNKSSSSLFTQSSSIGLRSARSACFLPASPVIVWLPYDTSVKCCLNHSHPLYYVSWFHDNDVVPTCSSSPDGTRTGVVCMHQVDDRGLQVDLLIFPNVTTSGSYTCREQNLLSFHSPASLPVIIAVNLKHIPEKPPVSTANVSTSLWHLNTSEVSIAECHFTIRYPVAADDIQAVWFDSNGTAVLSTPSCCGSSQKQFNMSAFLYLYKNDSDTFYTCWAMSPSYTQKTFLQTFVPFWESKTETPVTVTPMTELLTVSSSPFQDKRQVTPSSAVISLVAILSAILIACIVSIYVFNRKRHSQVETQVEVANPFTEKACGGFTLDAQSFEISPNLLIMGDQLGVGHFGTVIKAEYVDAGFGQTEVAVKMIRNPDDKAAMQSFLEELKMLTSLGEHKHVVKVFGFSWQHDLVSIVMEYACHGDLRTLLRRRARSRLSSRDSGVSALSGDVSSTVPEVRVRSTSGESIRLDDVKMFSYGLQIAKGMEFVISRHFVHGDLAARNVLVGDGEVLKISDFGLAKDLGGSEYYKSTKPVVLPYRWCSPEVLLRKIYSEYSDVWSFGILLWEIATCGGTPYLGVPVEKLMDLLTTGSYRMSKPRGCSEPLYDIMVHCWDEVPDRRPRFLHLVELFQELKATEVRMDGESCRGSSKSVIFPPFI